MRVTVLAALLMVSTTATATLTQTAKSSNHSSDTCGITIRQNDNTFTLVGEPLNPDPMQIAYTPPHYAHKNTGELKIEEWSITGNWARLPTADDIQLKIGTSGAWRSITTYMANFINVYPNTGGLHNVYVRLANFEEFEIPGGRKDIKIRMAVQCNV